MRPLSLPPRSLPAFCISPPSADNSFEFWWSSLLPRSGNIHLRDGGNILLGSVESTRYLPKKRLCAIVIGNQSRKVRRADSCSLPGFHMFASDSWPVITGPRTSRLLTSTRQMEVHSVGICEPPSDSQGAGKRSLRRSLGPTAMAVLHAHKERMSNSAAF